MKRNPGLLRSLRPLLRSWQICRVLVRHGLQEFVYAAHLLGSMRIVVRFIPRHKKHTRENLGARIRCALEDLGPIFVKFGQALSTRPDLLPEDIADELAKLQDRVPPFAGELAVQILERAYRRPLREVFTEFSSRPLASASIAQVHPARLPSGEEVVVKVLRPNVQKFVERDLEVMWIIARLAQRYWSLSQRLKPLEIVKEYQKTILDELDLLREAANAAQLRRNFLDSDLLYVPEIYWDYCRTDVLVMERVHGIPIGDLASLRAQRVNMRVLAERGVEIFFKQVFEDNFFHADMHPGNIFVDASDPERPRYKAVDFGIVGTLTPDDQRYLASNFLAFFNRDYRRVAELHIESGWVPAGTRVDEFESAIRTVSEPIFNRPLKEISFGHFLVRLFQTARRFDMEIQPQLVLLQKTLLNIEGLGRQLYPDLDLWQTAKPFLENWMRKRTSPLNLIREIRRQWPQWVELLRAGPQPLLDRLRADQRAQRTPATRGAAVESTNEEASIKIKARAANQGLRLRQWAGVALFGMGFAVVAWDQLNLSISKDPWMMTTTAATVAIVLGLFLLMQRSRGARR